MKATTISKRDILAIIKSLPPAPGNDINNSTLVDLGRHLSRIGFEAKGVRNILWHVVNECEEQNFPGPGY